ncbi:MAG TPA: hypothetical protein VEZ50_03615 [Nodosilinea sp.]|nr:hypothetical protein [Nodosilinea sp.]
MGTTQGFIRKVMGLGRRVVAQVVAKTVTFGAIALLIFTTTSCAKPVQPTELIAEPTPQPNRLIGQIAEVSPPETLESLKQIIDAYTPQVRILSPRPGEVLDDTSVSVRLQVRGLPLFKDDTYELGPHLHLFLDNEPYQAVYDLSEPVTFADLSPGTHTLRVFASRPWHEGFKNQGAFDQRTFHVVAPTPQNELNAKAPLLTYSRPQAAYGAEPIMLDFYLTNAPLHMSAQAEANDDLHDWRIRCTVNDQSFVFDQWQPIWLKGFKPGRNWVQLELIDESGNPIDNRFNNTVRIIDYQPGGSDTLSRLVRGELSLQEVAGIIDPTYVPPAPEPTVEPQATEPEPPAADSEPSARQIAEPEPIQPDIVAPAEPEPVQELPPAEPPTESIGPDAATQAPAPLEPDPETPSNPSLLPEKPTEPEATREDTFAREDGTEENALENSQPSVSQPSTEEPTVLEPRAKDEDEDIAPSAPFIPPVLPQPEVLPEPLRPAPDQPAVQEPAPKGLLNRFKQWRDRADQPEMTAPLPIAPVPEALGDSDTPAVTLPPEVLVGPEGQKSVEDALEDVAPDLPSPVEPDPTALLSEPEPFEADPQGSTQPNAEPPGPQEPVELPRIQTPPTAPRSPLVPEVRPFI